MGGEQKKESTSRGRMHSFSWKSNSHSVWPPSWMLHGWLRHMPQHHGSLLSTTGTHCKLINVRLKYQIPYRTKNCTGQTMGNEKNTALAEAQKRWPNGKTSLYLSFWNVFGNSIKPYENQERLMPTDPVLWLPYEEGKWALWQWFPTWVSGISKKTTLLLKGFSSLCFSCSWLYSVIYSGLINQSSSTELLTAHRHGPFEEPLPNWDQCGIMPAVTLW